ncbi:MAG: hypothetical protein HY317_02730 [Acidobacteria bacterium]|nr:hypothetical protein [Acidobacteriota bacterium]
MDDQKAGAAPAPEDDPVPVFGTWRRIYAAVIVSALVVMGLVAVFSNWPY